MRHILVFAWFVAITGTVVGQSTKIVTFEKDIVPILKTNCWRCHGDEKREHALDLRTRASIIRGGKTGAALRPGSLRDSLIWMHIATDKMPATKTKLNDAQKDTIRQWIVAGAPAVGVKPLKVARPAAPVGKALKKQGVKAIVRKIDDKISEKLRTKKIPVSPTADDATFLRRIYLDLTGRVPTIQQTERFLADTNPDRRSKLIDALLESKLYGQHFGVIWEKLLIPRTAPAYRSVSQHQKAFRQWLADDFNKNGGWDETVRQLLTASGQLPPRGNRKAKGPVSLAVSYMMIHTMDGRPQPKMIAASSSRLFLAQSMDCAQCHNHPLSKWRRTDFWGVAAFFERIRFPSAGGGNNANSVLSEPSKGKDLVYNQKDRYYFVPGIRPEPVIAIESSQGTLTEKLVRARFLDGTEPEMDLSQSYREVYAKWVTDKANPYFARAATNRLWNHFFGRGFVEPVDDMSEDNPPSHPELLQLLADEFAASGFDRKHLIRCICNSETYQRSSKPLDGNVKDVTLFSHQSMRQMSAEVLLDSLCLVVPPLAKVRKESETSKRGRNANGRFTKEFLQILDAGEGSPTEFSRGLQQALRLMNADGKLFNSEAVRPLISSIDEPAKRIERIYLAVLSRRPSERELSLMMRYVKDANSSANGKEADKRNNQTQADPYADIFWVLINSSEFICNH